MDGEVKTRMEIEGERRRKKKIGEGVNDERKDTKREEKGKETKQKE